MIINALKKPDTWKIQLRITINFIPSEDIDEGRVMLSKSDNIEFMIEELLESLLNKYQIGLETSLKDSDFILGYAHLFY